MKYWSKDRIIELLEESEEVKLREMLTDLATTIVYKYYPVIDRGISIKDLILYMVNSTLKEIIKGKVLSYKAFKNPFFFVNELLKKHMMKYLSNARKSNCDRDAKQTRI